MNDLQSQPNNELPKFTDLKAFVNSFNDAPSVINCKLCNSKFRKEAEDMSEQGHRVTNIHRWLQQQGEEISYGAVNNHIHEHLRLEQDTISLREFATRLGKWRQMTKADDVLLNRYIDFFDMEAMTLAAENNKLNGAERRKNDELILKIGQLILSYKEQLHRLHIEMRPVEVVITSLNRIIKLKLEGSSSPEVKRVLTDIVETLMREVGDVPIVEIAE